MIFETKNTSSIKGIICHTLGKSCWGFSPLTQQLHPGICERIAKIQALKASIMEKKQKIQQLSQIGADGPIIYIKYISQGVLVGKQAEWGIVRRNIDHYISYKQKSYQQYVPLICYIL